MEKTKVWYTSKEIWVVGLGLLNLLLNWFKLPSIDPSPEFYAAIMLIVGILRTWFTDARLVWKKE